MKIMFHFSFLVLISLFIGCSSAPYRTKSDLPDSIVFKETATEARIEWFWKVRATLKERQSSLPLPIIGAFFINSMYVNEDYLQKYNGQKGMLIGSLATSEGEFIVVSFNGEYFFIRENHWQLYTKSKQYIIRDTEAEPLRNGEFLFSGQAPPNSIIANMNCTNNFQSDYTYDLYSGNIKFNREVELPSGGAIYVGQVPSFEAIREFLPNKFPMYEIRVCGVPAGERTLETRSGMLRNFEVQQIRYILFYWGSLVIAYPSQ